MRFRKSIEVGYPGIYLLIQCGVCVRALSMGKWDTPYQSTVCSWTFTVVQSAAGFLTSNSCKSTVLLLVNSIYITTHLANHEWPRMQQGTWSGALLMQTRRHIHKAFFRQKIEVSSWLGIGRPEMHRNTTVLYTATGPDHQLYGGLYPALHAKSPCYWIAANRKLLRAS